MQNDIGGLFKQAQAVQQNLEKARAELLATEVTGEAGAGMVKVTMNGRHDCRSVHIDPQLLTDKDMLEDLLAAAINDAALKIETLSKEKMGNLAAGLNLPGGFKLPF